MMLDVQTHWFISRHAHGMVPHVAVTCHDRQVGSAAKRGCHVIFVVIAVTSHKSYIGGINQCTKFVLGDSGSHLRHIGV